MIDVKIATLNCVVCVFACVRAPVCACIWYVSFAPALLASLDLHKQAVSSPVYSLMTPFSLATVRIVSSGLTSGWAKQPWPQNKTYNTSKVRPHLYILCCKCDILWDLENVELEFYSGLQNLSFTHSHTSLNTNRQLLLSKSLHGPIGSNLWLTVRGNNKNQDGVGFQLPTCR